MNLDHYFIDTMTKQLRITYFRKIVYINDIQEIHQNNTTNTENNIIIHLFRIIRRPNIEMVLIIILPRKGV